MHTEISESELHCHFSRGGPNVNLRTKINTLSRTHRQAPVGGREGFDIDCVLY